MKKNRKIRVLMYLSLIVTLLFVSACGTNDEAQSTQAEPATSEEASADTKESSAEPTQDTTDTKESSKPVEESDSDTKTVTDMDGVSVTLPNKVDGVAVAGALNQMVLILGQPEKIVATAEGVQKSFFATVYPGIKDVPAAYVGAGKGDLNMETLLSAKPQVVFGSFSDDEKKTLEDANIQALNISMLNPEEIKQTLSVIAQVLGDGAEEKAEAFNQYYDENLALAEDKTKDAKKVRVFVANGDGSQGAIATVGKKDIQTSYIESAGGINVAAEQEAQANGSVQVDFEFLMEEQPDVIVAMNKTVYDTITDSSNGSQWQNLTAVKNGKVYLVPKGVYLWAVRSCEGALQPLWLGTILHPDLFEDINMEEKTKEFYKNFYNYDLTDEETELIFSQGI